MAHQLKRLFSYVARTTPVKPSEESVRIIKSSVPLLKEHRLKITQTFYPLLFKSYPETTNIFNLSNQRDSRQAQALANAVYHYAENIDTLGNLEDAVKRIVSKHCALRVQPYMYSYVEDCLLRAIGSVLGPLATPEVMRAWKEAYVYLAQILINCEAEAYQTSKAQGGWDGFKPFTVIKKVKESSLVTSFYLQPQDGQLAKFLPGQYITLKVGLPDQKSFMRHYSLSAAPGEPYYRISVKREGSSTTPEGLSSTYLHDYTSESSTLSVAAPFGHFFLNPEHYESSSQPIVLVSVGIGCTPLVSMIHTLVQKKVKNQVFYFHGCRSGSFHTFKDEIRQLVKGRENFHLFTTYTSPLPWDQKGKDYDGEGQTDISVVRAMLPSNEGQFYFCGPTGFITNFEGGLNAWGVDARRTHHEFFKPEP